MLNPAAAIPKPLLGGPNSMCDFSYTAFIVPWGDGYQCDLSIMTKDECGRMCVDLCAAYGPSKKGLTIGAGANAYFVGDCDTCSYCSCGQTCVRYTGSGTEIMVDSIVYEIPGGCKT